MCLSYTNCPTIEDIRSSAWMNPANNLSVKYVSQYHAQPGKPERVDDEYVRNGVAEIFLEVEPLAGRRHVDVDRTQGQNRLGMVDQRHARRTLSGCTQRAPRHGQPEHPLHRILYETFPPEEARRLAERLEIHYTPKHGSWLNIAEIELSVLKGQCLDRRIPDMQTMRKHVAAWENDRNNRQSKISWQFSTTDARIKTQTTLSEAIDVTWY